MALDLKKAALAIGEDTLKAVIKDIVRPFAEQKIIESPNQYDNLLLPFLDQLETALLQAVDKIDGEQG